MVLFIFLGFHEMKVLIFQPGCIVVLLNGWMSQAAQILGTLLQAHEQKAIEGVRHPKEAKVVYMAGHVPRLQVATCNVNGGECWNKESCCQMIRFLKWNPKGFIERQPKIGLHLA